MAKVTLTQLHCTRKQDVTGSDEPELFIAGQSVWVGKMSNGDTRSVNVSRNFNDHVRVELKEKNANSYKLLGSWDFPAISESNSQHATGSGYDYTLWYKLSA
jgi:hypothetical protein